MLGYLEIAHFRIEKKMLFFYSEMGYLEIAHFRKRESHFLSYKSGPNKKSKYLNDVIFNADYNFDTFLKWAISR